MKELTAALTASIWNKNGNVLKIKIQLELKTITKQLKSLKKFIAIF